MKQQTNYYFWSNPDDATMYDVYQLFQYYDVHFFSGQLEKCTVRWTKKMTLCAGTCKYEGFGSSTISLSEPLLKFRSSNQLKQTLLHQMIHAFLFKTNPAACQSQGGHGPAFKQIMTKINRITGLNITVYHSFHDEVAFYKQHVWRCNGRCRDDPPYYGYVKRSMNRAPQVADFWFADHRRVCGGQFIKISGPQKQNQKQKLGKQKKPRKSKKISEQKDSKKWGTGKSIIDYIKQMQNEQSNKSNRQQSNINSKSSVRSDSKEKQSNIFNGKSGKTLEEYWKQMREEQQKSKIQKEEHIIENQVQNQENMKKQERKSQLHKLIDKYQKK